MNKISVHDNYKAVHMTSVNFGFISNVTILDYRYLQNYDESCYCIESCSTNFPFNSLSSNKDFVACCVSTDSEIII